MSMTAASLGPTPRQPSLISREGWFWVAALGVLFVALFWNAILRVILIATDTNEPRLAFYSLISFSFAADWSHGLLLPFIGLYYIVQHREDLLERKREIYWPGLLVLLGGMYGYAFWIYPGRNAMLQGYCMVMALLGLVWFLTGRRWTAVLWFPIVYLALGIQVSQRIWDPLAVKLQYVAAGASAIVLKFFGLVIDVDAEVRGSTIILYEGGQSLPPLNVAEACAGLRMLMAFVALGVAMAFLSRLMWWQKAIMIALSVPIAVIVNVGRVTALGLIYAKGDPAYAQGDFHTAIGMLMLIPAALLFLLLGWVLDNIVIHKPMTSAPLASLPGSASTHRSLGELMKSGAVYKGVVVGAGVTLAAGVVLAGVGFAASVALNRLPGLELPGPLPRLSPTMQTALLLLALFVLAFYGLHRLQKQFGKLGQRPSLLAAALAGGVLLVGAAGLNGVVELNNIALRKEAVPLVRPLDSLPDVAGRWKLESIDAALPKDQLEALGTKAYTSRVYRDTQAGPASPVSPRVRLHVAYYTGTPDTTPHVAPRCFVAGGMQPRGETVHELQFEGEHYRPADDGWVTSTPRDELVRVPDLSPEATIFTFTDPRQPTVMHNVVYFFVANGRFLPGANSVRAQGFNLTDRYAYYCKVEVLVIGPSTPEQARRQVSVFLSDMMPHILACLPDWHEVQTGQWPPEDDAARAR